MLLSRPWYLAGLLGSWLPLLATPMALAQITPDATLGSEASLVSPGMELPSGVADLIEGGAIRGGNLFHSFLEFNIDPDQRVYFANPAGIESILSRITGGNPSNILGTLGVNGAADLFLINPNGFVFGETATLDIQGSFYASTAEAIPLGEGVYSATAPEQSSLLTVNPSALFSSYLSDASGDIENRGQLAAQGNMTLAANNLDLQGQVAAGGDLTLLGNTVQIRDAVDTPFVGFAGGDLLVQGNEAVDIVALGHPDSGLYSYGNMVLRSANPVGGDAHYWSGGSFQVENLEGNGGSLYSPIDPIIRASGDVFIEDYLGSSLHILAGGSVTIGTAEITAPDPGTVGIDFLQETIALSDGTVVQIDGAVQPTLDVRAGVNPVALGTPPLEVLTGFNPVADTFFGEAFTTETPSTADITVGDVLIAAPNGLVLLTNQYEPNRDLPGGDLSVTGAGFYGNGINATNFTGSGGTVYLDARGNLSVINSFINTTSLDQGGDIVVLADGTVTFDGTDSSRTTGAFSNLALGGTGRAGNVRVAANNLIIRNGAQLNSLVFGEGLGGNVFLDIQGTARFEGNNAVNGLASGISSGITPNSIGTGGNVQLTTGSLEVLNGAQISTSSFGEGDAGNVILVVEGLARFEGSNAIDGSASGAFSNIAPNGIGTGGNVQLTTGSLEVLNGAQISTSSFGEGDAGNVILVIEGLARFEGSNAVDGSASGAFSNIAPNGIGTGGNVQLTASSLEVLNGAQLNVSIFGLGDAGSVILDIVDTVRFTGSNLADGSASGAFSRIEANGEGTGGNIQITARTLEVLDGATLSASSFGVGDAGSVILDIAELTRFMGSNPVDGSASGVFSSIQPDGEGQSGNVQINSRTLEVLDGAQIGVSTFGLGNAGSVILDIAELARFVGSDPVDGSASGVFSSVELDGEGQGGNVQINSRTLEVLDGAQIGVSTFGLGDAGSVILDIAELARFVGSDPVDGIPSGAFSSIEPNGEGQGGNVQISARTLEVLDGAVLSASTFGIGHAGSVILDIAELARFVGTNPVGSSASGAFSTIEPDGEGQGGNVEITATNLEVLNGAQLGAGTFGLGNAGSVILTIEELARFVGTNLVGSSASGAFSSIEPNGEGQGGNVQISATNLEILQGAVLRTASLGVGNAGDIILLIPGQILVDYGSIRANSETSAGGQINIQSGGVILRNDSDIQTFVSRGAGGGGNITIAANFLIAFDDSDILAFSADGQGGDIDLSRTTFFGQNANIASGQLSREELLALDGNDRVDVNASGGVEPGQITVGDTSFIENSLTNLADAIVDTAALTAGSCIARTDESLGSFTVTGSGGLPQRPGDSGISSYPTGTVRTGATPTPLLQEPDGVYQLPDGRLVLSRACE